ncbi:MAG: hypothetical protein AB7F22_30085, partial [Reyranella sp.]
MSVPDRGALLDHDHEQISVRRQCRLLGIARSGVYRECRPANDNDLGLMRRIDELFTSWPFLGSRRLARMLREEGHPVPMDDVGAEEKSSPSCPTDVVDSTNGQNGELKASRTAVFRLGPDCSRGAPWS